MVIGFIGSHDGLTKKQKVEVFQCLEEKVAAGEQIVGLHGDEMGGDHDFNDICVSLSVPTRCRPSTQSRLRAWTGAMEIAGPEAPQVRDQKIVRNCDFLIICPDEHISILGLTAASCAVDMARLAGRLHLVVRP